MVVDWCRSSKLPDIGPVIKIRFIRAHDFKVKFVETKTKVVTKRLKELKDKLYLERYGLTRTYVRDLDEDFD